MNWQPVTHSDHSDAPALHAPLPFELDEADRAQAIAARYYIQQHVQRLNAQDAQRRARPDCAQPQAVDIRVTGPL